MSTANPALKRPPALAPAPGAAMAVVVGVLVKLATCITFASMAQARLAYPTTTFQNRTDIEISKRVIPSPCSRPTSLEKASQPVSEVNS
jgi:hypothetical protein